MGFTDSKEISEILYIQVLSQVLRSEHQKNTDECRGRKKRWFLLIRVLRRGIATSERAHLNPHRQNANRRV